MNLWSHTLDPVIISLEVLRVLYRYDYNMNSDYIKFTIDLVVETSSGIYRLTVGKVIPLFDSNGAKPGFDIAPPSISNSDILSLILDDLSSSIVGLEVLEAKSMNKEKPRYSNHITVIKPKTTMLRPFIVADNETLLDEKSNAHVPDVVGYMLYTLEVIIVYTLGKDSGGGASTSSPKPDEWQIALDLSDDQITPELRMHSTDIGGYETALAFARVSRAALHERGKGHGRGCGRGRCHAAMPSKVRAPTPAQDPDRDLTPKLEDIQDEEPILVEEVGAQRKSLVLLLVLIYRRLCFECVGTLIVWPRWVTPYGLDPQC
ncbi:hypothetical protein RND71_026118 [Anisodus tanguticus]|uniref:Uncharacterized protein n=1 Tax=Anisodus tanguticus TaxID=243964 RepID=A0AAE1RK78_9SOLA|nr:hypothetical protein RND71_026118 [Anisodus tanguticus]